MFVDWVEAQALANTALVVTSAGAIAYAALQLRHERQYRAVTNLEKQLEFFHSESYVAARRSLAVARVDAEGQLTFLDTNEPPVSAFEVLDLYEHFGLLVKKGHLDPYDVWHTFYEWIQPVYADLSPITQGRNSQWADHYTDLRDLVATMDAIQRERMRKRKLPHHQMWSRERIAEHYRYEIQANDLRPGQRRPRRNSLARASSDQ